MVPLPPPPPPPPPPASAAPSVVAVVFGASGDLAHKKIFPALLDIFARARTCDPRDSRSTEIAAGALPPLPRLVRVVGYARSAMTDADFRARLCDSLSAVRPAFTTTSVGAATAAAAHGTLDAFLAACSYVSAAYDSQDAIRDALAPLVAAHSPDTLFVFYLAIPPSVFLPTAAALRRAVDAVLPTSGALLLPRVRLVVEKPFGTDRGSARELLASLAALWPEENLYRIDHYLGKFLVKNIPYLRAHNPLLSRLWDAESVSCVIISLKEAFGTYGRGGYFDPVGIIRDVIQNHLAQLLALLIADVSDVATNHAADGATAASRLAAAKAAVLRSFRPATPERTVLGQYAACPSSGAPGYRDDSTVAPGSLCPTFAACVLESDAPAWRGVPFVLRAGKALDATKCEIRIVFRGATKIARDGRSETVKSSPLACEFPNELVLRVQPNECVYLKLHTLAPAATAGAAPLPAVAELDLTYASRFPGSKPTDAYTALLLDVILGDKSSFVCAEELDASWAIFTPLLHAIDAANATSTANAAAKGSNAHPSSTLKVHDYEHGSRGPAAYEEMLVSLGVVLPALPSAKNAQGGTVTENSGLDYKWPRHPV